MKQFWNAGRRTHLVLKKAIWLVRMLLRIDRSIWSLHNWKVVLLWAKRVIGQLAGEFIAFSESEGIREKSIDVIKFMVGIGDMDVQIIRDN